ncbi:ankyrin repeat domain-containing protein SOWAHC [Rhinophrynus dorsalis]
MPELSREYVISFLAERGGRVPNQQLVDHFRSLLTEPPPGDARNAARQLLKDLVNEVASVRADDGVKYVCLRKKYRGGGQPSDIPVPGDATVETPECEPPRENGECPTPSTEVQREVPSPPGTKLTPSISVTEFPGTAPEQSGGDEEDRSHSIGKLCPGSPELCLSSGRTPRGSRRGLRDPVSPQLRRGGGLLRAGMRMDSDSSSLHSSSSVSGNEEEDGGGSVSGTAALDPLEHAWMLNACRGRWEALHQLLDTEPGLIPRRDFITGFSCLHWAAKHGQHELLAALLTHARQHRVPVNINARAAGGYTALHLAAMHGHLDVIKLLVGAYDTNVDIRDYSGRKAWQYLSPDTARDVQGLVGAHPEGEEEDGGNSGSGRWRLSKVLPSNLIVHRLSQLPEDEQDGPVRSRADIIRKGSGLRGKPRVNKIRFRTQIIHTNLSGRDDEEDDRPLKSPVRHRPKSNVFG